jgi:hypothetical protein
LTWMKLIDGNSIVGFQYQQGVAAMDPFIQ